MGDADGGVSFMKGWRGAGGKCSIFPLRHCGDYGHDATRACSDRVAKGYNEKKRSRPHPERRKHELQNFKHVGLTVDEGGGSIFSTTMVEHLCEWAVEGCMVKLASCRLCGGKPVKCAHWNEGLQHQVFYVGCQSCLARSNGAFTRSEANTQWNQIMNKAVADMVEHARR